MIGRSLDAHCRSFQGVAEELLASAPGFAALAASLGGSISIPGEAAAMSPKSPLHGAGLVALAALFSWGETASQDAAVAQLMAEYEALKAERQALSARLGERQRAEAAESAKIEAELEALAAETVALNREMARREASGYADGPMPPEETRPRQFRRKPSVTATPWR